MAALSLLAACMAFTAPSAPLALRGAKIASCAPRRGVMSMKMSIADNVPLRPTHIQCGSLISFSMSKHSSSALLRSFDLDSGIFPSSSNMYEQYRMPQVLTIAIPSRAQIVQGALTLAADAAPAADAAIDENSLLIGGGAFALVVPLIIVTFIVFNNYKPKN